MTICIFEINPSGFKIQNSLKNQYNFHTVNSEGILCYHRNQKSSYPKQSKIDHWLCYNSAKRLYFAIIILAERSPTESLVQTAYTILPTTNILKDADYLTSAQSARIFFPLE